MYKGAIKMNLKSSKAITLVALIITIIILLILAGVSLSMILGDNGLINKAQSSVDKYQQSANNEQAMLNSIEDYFKEYMPGEEMPLPAGWDGTKVTAISDGKHNIIPVPKDFYYVGGNLGNGVIISDNPADKYDGSVDKTTWEYTTSLVGNQFVWIPCTEAEYHKTTNWAGTGQPQWGQYDPTESNATEKAKVLKYGGFYVARYEAGLADGITKYDTNHLDSGGGSPGYDVTGTPKSKAGQDPWIFISQTNSKANAESWYASSSSVESGLITGTQWDVMLKKFIGTTNENGVTFTENDMVNSYRWGNYYNPNIPYTGRTANFYQSGSSWYITPFTTTVATGTTGTNQMTEYTTGASKVAESYHIYDVAGNIWEWTEEIGGPDPNGASVGPNFRVFRGGSCHNDSSSYPACFRHGDSDASRMGSCFGFRAVLYIK